MSKKAKTITKKKAKSAPKKKVAPKKAKTAVKKKAKNVSPKKVKVSAKKKVKNTPNAKAKSKVVKKVNSIVKVKKASKTTVKVPVATKAKKNIKRTIQKIKKPSSNIASPQVEMHGEDLHLIPDHQPQKPITTIEVHAAENTFQRKEEVAFHEENKKVQQSIISQKNAKRFGRRTGRR